MPIWLVLRGHRLNSGFKRLGSASSLTKVSLYHSHCSIFLYFFCFIFSIVRQRPDPLQELLHTHRRDKRESGSVKTTESTFRFISQAVPENPFLFLKILGKLSFAEVPRTRADQTRHKTNPDGLGKKNQFETPTCK